MTTKVLTDEQIEQGREATFSTNNPYCPCDSKTMRKAARWAEQAVLQSEQVQAWKRDAERYRWLRDDGDGFTIDVREEGDEGENWVTGYPPDDLDAAVDAAMEKQP